MSGKEILRQHWDDKGIQGFQIYNELFNEEGDVYLQLEGFHFQCASSGSVEVNGAPTLTVRLSREWVIKLGIIDEKSRT